MYLHPLIFLLLAGSCNCQNYMTEFIQGNRLFTENIVKSVLETEQGNFMISPLSAQIILSLLLEGAKEETLDQLAAGLHVSKNEENRQNALSQVIKDLTKTSEIYDLFTANKIYAAENLQVKSPFLKIAEEVYKIQYENVDFSQRELTASKINQWVEEQTNNRITNLIDPFSLNEYIYTVLVNTLYMKANWTTKFEDAIKRDFYIEEGKTIQADIMHLQLDAQYYEDEEIGAQFLRLSYKTEDTNKLSMTIILPREKLNIQKLEENLNKVFNADIQFFPALVSVYLPKFRVETTIKFVPILQAMGIKNIFDPSTADLSNIVGEKGDLVVTDVLQKTFIEVTESETEAAAATGIIGTGPTSVNTPLVIEFKADHPFLYYISLNEYILFTGKILDPTQ